MTKNCTDLQYFSKDILYRNDLHFSAGYDIVLVCEYSQGGILLLFAALPGYEGALAGQTIPQ